MFQKLEIFSNEMFQFHRVETLSSESEQLIQLWRCKAANSRCV